MSDLVPGLVSKPEDRVAIMRKGGRVRLADYCTGFPPPVVTCGLAWDVTDGINIDLDASIIVLDANLRVLDIVFFGKLQSSDGAIQHSGDEREGDEKGDDEKIHVQLARVHPAAAYLCICINSYTGQELDDVKDAQCRLHVNERNLAVFKLTNAAFLDGHVALCVGYLYREPSDPNSWCFEIQSEAAQGRTAHDNVDEFQRFLKQHPPAIVPPRAPPPVPAAAPQMTFTTVVAQQMPFEPMPMGTPVIAAAPMPIGQPMGQPPAGGFV